MVLIDVFRFSPEQFTRVTYTEHQDTQTPREPEVPVVVQGIKLHTVPVRRGLPDVQDQALNSHSKLNCITACVAANQAGADEGLMLDPDGFVATCNSVNFFIVVRCESAWADSHDCLVLAA